MKVAGGTLESPVRGFMEKTLLENLWDVQMTGRAGKRQRSILLEIEAGMTGMSSKHLLNFI